MFKICCRKGDFRDLCSQIVAGPKPCAGQSYNDVIIHVARG
jgi:hypothetical protein